MKIAKNIVIIGAGGHSKVISDIVLACGDNVYGYLDDNKSGFFYGYPILDKINNAYKYRNNFFIVALGNNKLRRKIAEQLDCNWYTAIHPSAIISKSVKIGYGSVVMPNVVINADTNIGSHCIINTSSIIEHDNYIDNYAHISPHATLCGTISVGKESWIGAGATIINNISIGDNCIIGAGSVVICNITHGSTAIGCPAHIL